MTLHFNRRQYQPAVAGENLERFQGRFLSRLTTRKRGIWSSWKRFTSQPPLPCCLNINYSGSACLEVNYSHPLIRVYPLSAGGLIPPAGWNDTSQFKWDQHPMMIFANCNSCNSYAYWVFSDRLFSRLTAGKYQLLGLAGNEGEMRLCWGCVDFQNVCVQNIDY